MIRRGEPSSSRSMADPAVQATICGHASSGTAAPGPVGAPAGSLSFGRARGSDPGVAQAASSIASRSTTATRCPVACINQAGAGRLVAR